MKITTISKVASLVISSVMIQTTVMAHLKIDKATYDAIPKDGGVIMPL